MIMNLSARRLESHSYRKQDMRLKAHHRIGSDVGKQPERINSEIMGVCSQHPAVLQDDDDDVSRWSDSSKRTVMWGNIHEVVSGMMAFEFYLSIN